MYIKSNNDIIFNILQIAKKYYRAIESNIDNLINISIFMPLFACGFLRFNIK